MLVAQGNLAEALKSYRDGLAIRERLAKADPQQRRLAARSVGVVQQGRRRAGGAGQLAEALKSYRDGLAIAERLAKADPSNTGWQRDLSVSYNKVGDVLVAQGNLAEALKSYRDSLAIAERLAEGRSAATPAGSAICRCRTTRSATCWWRRATLPRR